MTSTTDLKTSLQAHWIWTSDDLPAGNQFVFFRKRFTLADTPNEDRVLITAARSIQA